MLQAMKKLYPPPPPRGPKVAILARPPLDIRMQIKEEKHQARLERIAAAQAAEEPIDEYLEEEEVEEEENLEGCTSEELLMRNTRSFRCLAQVAVSSSSLLRSIEYNFPPLTDPGLDAAFETIEPEPEEDVLGLKIFVELCVKYKLIPIRRVISSIDTPVMNLKFYGLRYLHMKCLMEGMKVNTYVETLILQNNYLSPQMAKMLGQMLEVNRTIRILNLKHCNLRPEGAAALKKSLSLIKAVTELDLSYNNLEDEGMKNLERIRFMSSLKILNLSHNNLSPECADSLEVIILRNKSISELDLSWNKLGSDESYETIFTAIARSDRLRILNLSNNGFCTELSVLVIFTSYLQQSKTLEELDLSWNRMPGGKFIKELRKGVLVNTSLKKLNLSYNPFNKDECLPLAQLVNVCENLEIVDLSNIYFSKRVKRKKGA